MFLGILLLFFAIMIWLVVYRYTIIHRILKLYDITDMNYKLLLVALAALNFFICYLLEVKTKMSVSHATEYTVTDVKF